MDSHEIRHKFLGYFTSKGHRQVASSSLVPQDDPSLLFTNAGMVQFKRIFTGEEKRDYQRATSSQKCVRAGGKHNDLENVGYTARHHTFFEMLGNFSFGDYFKSQAISYAWELLTEVYGLPADKLYATVYEDDDEAFGLWEKIAGLPSSRIYRLGDKDNFWAMGDTGPCGPCSEILIDQGPEMGCGSPGCAPGCDCDRYLEIWNLVFMQFERAQDGSMTRLPRPSIDTGMGLERLAAVIQKVPSNFETDAFRPLLDKISSLSGRPYLYGLRLTPEDADFQTNVSLRVVADHARAVTFLAGDGVRPDNLGRGYVLRRILRRAIRHGRKLGLDKPFMAEMAVKVIEGLSQAYPDLADQASYISKLITSEEERFIETIGSGLSLLGEAISQIKAIGASHIPGQITFKLYDTYGFPLDLVADAAREQGLSVDIAGFEAAMAEQKAKGRAAWKSSGALEKDETVSLINTLSAQGFNNFFSGYDSLEEEGQKPAMLIKGGIAAETAAEGDEVILVFPRTPFYATSGGQKGDSGRILFPNGEIRVDDTAKAPGSGLFLHQGQVVSGRVAASEEARLIVDREKREATAANHSATHLLHRALRETLGDHVRQAGSLVSSERLRFDFSHFAPVSLAELEKIESLANLYIAEDSPVQTEVMGMEKAVRSGAMALFEERYGEEVRVVTMGASRELCGGTHAERTGRIGFLAIVSESAVSAGVRRLECLTGQAALGEFQSQRRNLRKISAIMKAKPEELPERIQKQANRIKELERSPKAQAGADNPAALAAESQKLENGLTFLAAKVSAPDPKSLRELGDLVRERMGPGYLLALASESLEGKALLLVTADKSVCSRLKSGDIIAGMAKAVGGKGGGRPDLAQAGGPDIQGIPKALALAREMVLNSLKNETV